jgi:DNA-binding NarL/FixJ family response regulator
MSLGSTLAQPPAKRAQRIVAPRATETKGWFGRSKPGMDLTPRLQELAELVEAGRSNRECARIMGLHEGTIKTMLSVVYRRRDISGGRHELAMVRVRKSLQVWMLKYSKFMPQEALQAFAQIAGIAPQARWLD